MDDYLSNKSTEKILNQSSKTISGMSGYVLSNKDDDATPNYYGYLNTDGHWYIMKEVVSAGDDTYTFAKGTSGYSAAWSGRVGLSYDVYNVVFG